MVYRQQAKLGGYSIISRTWNFSNQSNGSKVVLFSIFGTFGQLILAFGLQIIIDMHNFTKRVMNGTPGTI